VLVNEERKYYVSLVVYDFNCDPEEITKQLGLRPSFAGRKGAMRELKPGHSIRLLNDTWELESGMNPSSDIEPQIVSILNQLDAAGGAVKVITSRYESNLKIGAYYPSSNAGIYLSKETIKRLGNYNLSIDLDQYYIGD
jgi:hypothetical protein